MKRILYICSLLGIYLIHAIAANTSIVREDNHIASVIPIIEQQGFSTNYSFVFSDKDKMNNIQQKGIVVRCMNVSVATQFIFGWNALRPEEAQFTFYMRLHNAKTGQWTEKEHKMVEWGGLSQRSFSNMTDISSFLYARLEINPGEYADGFEIRVVSDNPKSLSMIDALFVNVSDFKAFKYTKPSAEFLNRPSIMLPNVPLVSQKLLLHDRNSGLCSPTSITILASYLLRKPLDALSVADYVYDSGLDIFGNWAFNTAHAYELIHKHAFCYPVRLESIEKLYDLIAEQQCPIVVSVTGELKGAAKNYKFGHLLVVRGFDPVRKKVFCNDPAFREIKKVFVEYDLQDFINAWERSYRMTYKIMRKKLLLSS